VSACAAKGRYGETSPELAGHSRASEGGLGWLAGGFMSFLQRLLGKSEPPKQRVRVCVECGMPVADHKQWCSILQGQNDMKLKATEAPR